MSRHNRWHIVASAGWVGNAVCHCLACELTFPSRFLLEDWTAPCLILSFVRNFEHALRLLLGGIAVLIFREITLALPSRTIVPLLRGIVLSITG